VKGEGVKRSVRIFLRYDARGTSSITFLARVVAARSAVYVGSHEIPKVLQVTVSTSFPRPVA